MPGAPTTTTTGARGEAGAASRSRPRSSEGGSPPAALRQHSAPVPAIRLKPVRFLHPKKQSRFLPDDILEQSAVVPVTILAATEVESFRRRHYTTIGEARGVEGRAPNDDQNQETPLDGKESRLGTDICRPRGPLSLTVVGAKSALLSVQWHLSILVVVRGVSFHPSGFTSGCIASPPKPSYLHDGLNGTPNAESAARYDLHNLYVAAAWRGLWSPTERERRGVSFDYPARSRPTRNRR